MLERAIVPLLVAGMLATGSMSTPYLLSIELLVVLNGYYNDGKEEEMMLILASHFYSGQHSPH